MDFGGEIAVAQPSPRPSPKGRGSSVDNIPQRLAEQSAAAGFAPFDPHVHQPLLAVEGVVGVQDDPVISRMLRVPPGDE